MQIKLAAHELIAILKNARIDDVLHPAVEDESHCECCTYDCGERKVVSLNQRDLVIEVEI